MPFLLSVLVSSLSVFDFRSYTVGMLELWEIFSPQASGFRITVSKMIGLNDVIWLSVPCRHYPYRVLHSNMITVSIDEAHKELHSILSVFSSLNCFVTVFSHIEPSITTDSKICARRMGYKEISLT